MGDHGRPWETTGDHGRPRQTMGDHVRPWETTGDHGRPWETTGDHGRPRILPPKTAATCLETTGFVTFTMKRINTLIGVSLRYNLCPECSNHYKTIVFPLCLSPVDGNTVVSLYVVSRTLWSPCMVFFLFPGPSHSKVV